jgi:hypothetical protein
MGQLKIFQVFNSSVFDDLIRIFGQENLVRFNHPLLIGIKYDYSLNKLPKIMGKIPFDQMQQVMIPSGLLLELLLYASQKGKRPSIDLNIELVDEEEKETFEELINNFRRNPSQENFQALRDELNRLEEEYFALPKSMSFLSDGERIVLQTNGILFASDNALNSVDDIISHYH